FHRAQALARSGFPGSCAQAARCAIGSQLGLRLACGFALATRTTNLLQAKLDGPPVSRETFELREPDHVGAELAQLRRLEAHKAHPFHEVFHPERREEQRRAA